GVLKALEEHCIFPEFITGTSMGALVGALYASGLSGLEIEALAVNMSWTRWAYLVDVTLIKPGGFIEGKRVTAMLKSLLHDLQFSQLRRHFACVATDIRSGREVVFREGSVADAVRASISLPGIFTPMRSDGRYLVDGGLVNEVPVKLCREIGASYVIGVNVNPDPAKLNNRAISKPPGLAEILTQTAAITGYHIALENMRDANLAINPEAEDIGFWQLQKAAECIRIGEEAARKVLDGIRTEESPQLTLDLAV
ncbi:MAG: patatin-like phospholipase family protein, partial [Dehalococcoidia bacterium]|nr:patatin-like phospholipase family protein [Dehalococcoidia bacterium]